VPPSALVELSDGTLALVVRRFDRIHDGGKLAMEDFCQLAELPPSGKYDGSAERRGKLVARFASEPLLDLLRLYRQFVFTWWVGNGDLHLKNLALLRDPQPVVARVLHDVEERRRHHDQLHARIGQLRHRRRRPHRKHRLSRERLGLGPPQRRHVLQQRLRLLGDDRLPVAHRRRLAALLVDLALRDRGSGLVGRQRVDREEVRRVPGQPVYRDHADPLVDGVESGVRRAGKEVLAGGCRAARTQ